MTGEHDTIEGISRRTALQTLGLAGATALAGCQRIEGVIGDSGTGQSKIRIAMELPPTVLDPVVIDTVPSAQVASQIFQGLYTYGEGSKLVPELAEGKPEVSDNGTTYDVKLTPEAHFHNGHPVTAEDVKYSFTAPLSTDPQLPWRHGTPTKWEVEMIKAIETPDEHTVTFKLNYPYPAFDHMLTRSIVPKAVREPDPATFASEPVGSGPYEVTRFVPGKYALLTRATNYWDTPTANIDQVKFVAVSAGLTRTMSLRSGQNQLIEPVHPKLWRATETIKTANVQSTDSYDYVYLGFNCNAGPAQDSRVRKAVDYCVNFDKMVRRMIEPAGVRQYGPVPRPMAEEWQFPIEEWKNIPYKRDVNTARRQLADAGVQAWAPTIAVPGTKSSGDELSEMLANAVVQGLNLAGFQQASAEKYAWPVFQKKILTGAASDYDMFIGRWSGMPDPDTFVYPLFHWSLEGETNGTFYRNPDVMESLRKAHEIDMHNERKQLYADAITTLLEERVHIPIYRPKISFGVKQEVRGFSPHPIAEENPQLVGNDHAVSSGSQK